MFSIFQINNGFAEDTAYDLETSPPLEDSEVDDEDDPWALVVPEDTGKAWAGKRPASLTPTTVIQL